MHFWKLTGVGVEEVDVAVSGGLNDQQRLLDGSSVVREATNALQVCMATEDAGGKSRVS